jgi:hypothetical protein
VEVIILIDCHQYHKVCFRRLGGDTGEGKGKNYAGAVQDYAHRRTQVAAANNTTTARSVIRHRCQCLV